MKTLVQQMNIRDLKETIKLGILNIDSVKPEYRAELKARICEAELELALRKMVR